MTLAIIFSVICVFLIATILRLYRHFRKNYENARLLLRTAYKELTRMHGYGVFKLLKEDGQDVTYIVNHNTKQVVTSITYVDDPSRKITAYVKARDLFDYSLKPGENVLPDDIYDQICDYLEPFEMKELA